MNRKQKRAQRTRHPKMRPSKRQRERVLTLTAAGKNRELVATEAGVSIAKLRTDYASELDKGRTLAAQKKADEAADEALSLEEYHFCDVLTDSFNSHWFDGHANILFMGMDGNGAKDISDAFAYWKSRGGHWNCTGLSSKFDPDKAVTFAKIVAEHRNKYQTEGET
jgi:hypothetical protein